MLNTKHLGTAQIAKYIEKREHKYLKLFKIYCILLRFVKDDHVPKEFCIQFQLFQTHPFLLVFQLHNHRLTFPRAKTITVFLLCEIKGNKT